MEFIGRFRGSNCQISQFQPGTKACNKAIINNDGDLLFVASGNDIFGYNLLTEKCFRVYSGHTGVVEDLDIDSNSVNLLSVGADETVYIHNVESGEIVMSFQVKDHLFRCCAISPLNQIIAVVTSTALKKVPTLYIYHISQNDKAHAKEKAHYPFEKTINCITFLSDNQILCGDVEGKLWVIDSSLENKDKKIEIIKTIDAHRGSINTIRKSWDGKMIATASSDQTARTWRRDNLDKIATFPHSFIVSSVAFSPISNHLVLGSSADKKNVARTNFGSTDFTLNFYKLIFQEEFASLKCFKSPINDVIFSPDGYTLVATAEEGMFMVIRLGEDYVNLIQEHKEEEEALKLAIKKSP